MKTAGLILIMSIFASLKTLALPMDELKTGDILLLDMDCFSCELIEKQTNGPFSHSGIILKYGTKVYVAQSLGIVHHLPLAKFLRYTNKPVQVVRPKFINFTKRRALLESYQNDFLNMPFDHEYTWDDDKLYCSEFIYKILKSVYAIENFAPKPMRYDVNEDGWRRYFGGNEPPHGQPGLSPNDFYRSSDFVEMGPLY